MSTQVEKMLVIEAAFVKQARVIDDLKCTVGELQKDRLRLREALEEIADLKRHVSALTVSESIAKRKAETMEFLLAKERAENDRSRHNRVEATDETSALNNTAATGRGRAAPRAASASALTRKAVKGGSTEITVRPVSHLDTNFGSAQKKVLSGPPVAEVQASLAPQNRQQSVNNMKQTSAVSVANPLSRLPQPRSATTTETLDAVNLRLLKFVGCSADDEAYLAETESEELLHLVACSVSSQMGRVPSLKLSRFVSQFLGKRSVLGKERSVFRITSVQNVAVLQSYLQDQLSSGRLFRVSELLSMLLDVAEDIAALHREKIMHGNLCPQNVFYCSGRDGNAGDAAALMVSGYSSLPVSKNFRYTPPEALEQPTAPGDVWAFGVLAWELCQYCAVVPYIEANSRKQLVEALQSGLRLKCPEQCPPNIFLRIVRPCFAALTQRPSIEDLIFDISELLQQVQ